MRYIRLCYEMEAARDRAARFANPLIDTLAAIQSSGSISGAARQLGYSFRHVWNQLKLWEAELGRPLTEAQRGSTARLSTFAERLLWSERYSQARLAPQIEALRAEIERSMALAFDSLTHVLPLHASHDDALTLLQDYASDHGQLHLDVRYMGSVDALRDLNEQRCVVAGFHARVHAPRGSVMARSFRPFLQPGRHKIMGFSWRAQGLMVASGNPLALRDLADTVRVRARWANRPLGSGTRVLLDDLLAEAGIGASQLQGYDNEQASSGAAAMAVVSGQADVALGVPSVARAHGLDLIALTQEHYSLVCLREALDTPPVMALRNVLASSGWLKQLCSVPGNTPDGCGQVQSLKSMLPWWAPRAPLPRLRRTEESLPSGDAANRTAAKSLLRV